MKLTQHQIERAAAALRQVVADRSGRGRLWEALPPHIKAQYRAEALAVIDSLDASCGCRRKSPL
jgi:hypothetical protein